MTILTAPLEDQICLDFEDLLKTVIDLTHTLYKSQAGNKKIADIIIWNNQVISIKFGEYSSNDPSIITGEGPERILPVKKIERALCDILENGVPFKTDSGTGDEVLCLEFEIND